MTGSAQTARIEAAVAPVLAPLGLLVDDIASTPAGKRRLVRISVDRDLADLDPQDHTSRVAPLSLDEVADATRAISDALDEGDVFGNAPYVLEVTSPGVHRALTEHRHYRRNVGRLLALTLRDGTALQGRLVGASPDTLTIDVAGAVRELPVGDVARAAVQVEFSHADDDELDTIDLDAADLDAGDPDAADIDDPDGDEPDDDTEEI